MPIKSTCIVEVKLAAVDPVKVGFIFLFASLTSLLFGGKILYSGWCGFRKGEYPLSESKQLTGFWGRVAASAICLFGLIAIGCGIVTLYFGYLRLRQLL